jgi:enamine deaminase RidA (YjgF/YER057c/UK114 family)
MSSADPGWPNSSTPAERLAKLGLVLPPVPSPIANFVSHVQHGDLLFLSGQGPRDAEGLLRTGKVGDEVTADQAYEHARLTGLNLLAVMQHALGDLGRVGRIVKLLGMVNAVPDFSGHPQVINGCSDLFVAVFGEKGRHARSAIGVGSLPGRITVEIEAIVSIANSA